MQKMTEVHLRNTVKRKATEDHGAYLRKCHFKFLADYLFTGAVRMHRWGLRPVLVTPQQHNNVMKQLVSQQPAQHSTLTGAAAALRTALQQQGWVLEITDLFTLILQLSCGDFAVEGALAPFLVSVEGQDTLDWTISHLSMACLLANSRPFKAIQSYCHTPIVILDCKLPSESVDVVLLVLTAKAK